MNPFDYPGMKELVAHLERIKDMSHESVGSAISDGYAAKARGEIHSPQDWSHEEQLRHIFSCPDERTWRDFDWPWWTFVTLCALAVLTLIVGITAGIQWLAA